MERVGIWVEYTRRWAPVIVVMSVAMYLLFRAARWTLERPEATARPWRRKLVKALVLGAWAWMLAAVALTSFRVNSLFPPAMTAWVEAIALVIAILSVSVYLNAWFVRRAPEFSPSRRKLLGTVKTAMVAAPAMAAGYGVFHERFQISLREVDIRLPGLPKDLEGLRIAQLSDLHRSVFFSREELDRAVAMANEARPHLTVVTGDLITRRGDPLDDCLDSLKALRADAGIFGCHGNHEVYARCADYATQAGLRQGLRFLRKEALVLRFGTAELNLAGVDYQRLSLPYLVGAESLVRPDAFNVLLSHNPDVFPVAVRKGFPLTLAGHTHGGQINVEILNDNLNLARFFTPYVLGEYRQGDAAIYVTPGLGTVGIPMRLGTRPEVTVIRLCAA
jgi:predicted MPP superfamily phosphohydrolase